MMSRDSALSEKTLREMRGMLKFINRPLQEILDELKAPEPKEWVHPIHPDDELGAVCSMSGWEIRELETLAREQVLQNPMLQKAFRDYMMVAKLILNDQLEKSRLKRKRIAEDKARSEASFVQKLAAYEGKKKSLTQSWEAARRALLAKWKYIIGCLHIEIQAEATLANLNSRDQVLLDELWKLGKVGIHDGKVTAFDEQQILDLSPDEVAQLVLTLERMTAPAGFLATPVVVPLDECSLTD